MRLGGKEKSLLRRADFTRSLDSVIAVEAIPTMENEGSPFVRVDSTLTTFASTPS
jgi:hypothetical protein